MPEGLNSYQSLILDTQGTSPVQERESPFWSLKSERGIYRSEMVYMRDVTESWVDIINKACLAPQLWYWRCVSIMLNIPTHTVQITSGSSELGHPRKPRHTSVSLTCTGVIADLGQTYLKTKSFSANNFLQKRDTVTCVVSLCSAHWYDWYAFLSTLPFQT